MNSTRNAHVRRTPRGLLGAGLLAAAAALAPGAAAQSTFIGSATTQGAPIRCVVQGRYAYVVTTLGLEIFLISPTASPIALGTFSVPAGDKYDLAVSPSSHVYLPSAAFGVEIIDVSNPSAPAHAGRISLALLGNDADFVDISAGRLYVNSADDGFRVFDIGASPTDPPRLGTYAPPVANHYLQDGQVSGTTYFVADSFNGLAAFDVSNPAAITKLADSGLVNTQSWDVALLGDVAVDLTFSGSTLRFYDVDAPLSNPLPLLDFEAVSGGGQSYEVDAAQEAGGNKYAYSAHSALGCKVWLIDDPTNVQLVETLPGTVGASGVVYYRGLLLIPVNYSGVRELQVWLR